MTKLLDELKNTLKQDDRLFADDKLLKNKAIERALDNDEKLLELLASNEKLKENFFTEAGEHLVFDEEKFAQFVSNKQFLPDSYTSFKNKIGLKKGSTYYRENEYIELAWPYKDCVLEGGQTKEDEGREEKFWNKTLAPDQVDTLLNPKVLSEFKRISADGEDEVQSISKDDNLLLRGNNLLALHTLLEEYRGEIDLIYIDPPYYFSSNKSGDTFAYNTNFKLSTWLTFMRNRLEVARELLSDDGSIFVQINDEAVSELHVLLKEIFNKDEEDNFINKITVETKSPSGFATVNPGVFEAAEYILSFAKHKSNWDYTEQYVESDYDKNYKWIIPNKDEDGYEDWEVKDLFEYVARNKEYESKQDAIDELGETAFYQLVGDFALENADKVFQSTAISDAAAKEIVEIRDKSRDHPNKIFHVDRDDHYDIYLQDGRELAFYSKKVREIDGELAPSIQVSDIWTDVPYQGISKEGGVKLKNGKKPEKLLRRIIEMASDPGDLVLDFFCGTGTTAAVAHKLDRQYIGVEQLEYGENDPVIRLKNVINGDSTGVSKAVDWKGGGDFVYAEIMEWNARFIEDIENAKNQEELQTVWEKMKDEAFLSYRLDVEEFEENAEEFEELELDKQKEFLKEILDNNQLYVNYSEIEDSDYEIDEETIELNNKFYES